MAPQWPSTFQRRTGVCWRGVSGRTAPRLSETGGPRGVPAGVFHGEVEVYTEDPRPGIRTGSGLYFKWSAGSWLLLRVPGLFNIVCNTRVARTWRTPDHYQSQSAAHVRVWCFYGYQSKASAVTQWLYLWQLALLFRRRDLFRHTALCTFSNFYNIMNEPSCCYF